PTTTSPSATVNWSRWCWSTVSRSDTSGSIRSGCAPRSGEPGGRDPDASAPPRPGPGPHVLCAGPGPRDHQAGSGVHLGPGRLDLDRDGDTVADQHDASLAGPDAGQP